MYSSVALSSYFFLSLSPLPLGFARGGGDCKSWQAKLEFSSVVQIAPGIYYSARWLNGPGYNTLKMVYA